MRRNRNPGRVKEFLLCPWMCIPCGLIYDEAAGMPEHGIAPGTRFADIPHDWTCPDCGVGKDDFVEIPD